MYDFTEIDYTTVVNMDGFWSLQTASQVNPPPPPPPPHCVPWLVRIFEVSDQAVTLEKDIGTFFSQSLGFFFFSLSLQFFLAATRLFVNISPPVPSE